MFWGFVSLFSVVLSTLMGNAAPQLATAGRQVRQSNLGAAQMQENVSGQAVTESRAVSNAASQLATASRRGRQSNVGAVGIRQDAAVQATAPQVDSASAVNEPGENAPRGNGRAELQRPGGDSNAGKRRLAPATCEPVYRACCYEAVAPAYCLEGVEIMDCSATGGRWDIDATLCSELDPPCGEYVGACCYGPIADPGYAPYQCIGDMLQWECLYLSEYTNWTGGATCSDPFFLCPGTPTYCDAGSRICDEYIQRVQMGDIDNSSGCGAGGYTDYTDFILTAVPGDSVPITVTNGTPYSIDVCSIWVDWNQDETFDDTPGNPECLGDMIGGGISPPYSFTMTVPADATPGYTRMRIRIDYNNPDPDPCGFPSYGEVEDYSVLVANGQGACCNLHTGECNDNVWASDCAALQFWYEQTCAGLAVPCGDPGCCCDYPEPGHVVPPYPAFHADCDGRFICGVTGADCTLGAFDPECGLVVRTGVLYCPSNADNPRFRSVLSALLGGAPVDFWNAGSQGTPSVDYMNPYAGVVTWANYPYADKVAMGNSIADYVDLGGRAILGQWCFPTAGNYLDGRIMHDPAYCPVASCAGYASGWYMGDGAQCATTDVSKLNTSYLDIVTALQPDAAWDGHIGKSFAAIWNGPRSVWYSPGNLGGTYESGDWAILTCNEVTCAAGPGPCCGTLTMECRDGLLPLDCAALGAEWQWHFGGLEGEITCADLIPPCGDPGACCDIDNGECTDDVLNANCAYEHHSNQQCSELDPLCGDPGCCCDSPEPGYWVPPHVELRANCHGRFVSGVVGEDCDGSAFVPDCYGPPPWGVLYCPSSGDNPAFRSALSVLLSAPVDFWNAYSQGTPSVEYMNPYAAVFTWANYPYADNVQMGNNIADYVDLGGRAILGQWCFPTAGNYLAGRVMSDLAYSPIASAAGWGSGSYSHNGQQCATMYVCSLVTPYLDNITGLRPGTFSDGTFTNGAPVAAWNLPMNVWYSAGNLGGTYESGDWPTLTYDEVICHYIPGPCCNVQTAECIDDLYPEECLGQAGAGWQPYFVGTCATLDPPCADPGACCDIHTGGCIDDVFAAVCESLDRVSHSNVQCGALTPPCGDPGCCCDRPELGYADNPHFAFRANCNGRFISGAFTLCGDLDENGIVDMDDYNMFLGVFGKCAGQSGFVAAADLDGDGCISLSDFQAWRNCYQFQGTDCVAEAFDPACGLQVISCDTTVGMAAPPPALCSATITPFPLDTRPVGGSASDIPTPCVGLDVIGLNPPCIHNRIGSGWMRWSHGYTGDIYWTIGATSLTLTMPAGTTTAYFYVEPNPFEVHTFDLLINGTVACDSFTANGSGGAAYAGVCGSPGSPIVTVQVSSDVDFAIGEFGIYCVDQQGACCDEATGNCTDGVWGSACTFTHKRFVPLISCGELEPECGTPGACCDDATGICTDDTLQLQCAGTRFIAGLACAYLMPPCEELPGWIIAPGSWSGNTCGAGSDCPLRSSQDNHVIIYFDWPGTWQIDLCASTPAWDTYLYLGSEYCTDTWRNDDGCTSDVLLSIVQAQITRAGRYVATVEAYSTACGAYTLTVTGPPQPQPGACCDEWAIPPVCTDGVQQAACAFPHARFGEGIACSELSPECGTIQGACCYDTECVYQRVVECTGAYDGDFEPCDPNPCLCADAAIIAPGSWSGTTCGAGDDCGLRAGQDLIVAVTIPTAGNWRFDLCASDNWDTYMYLGTACCQATWQDDDGCSTYSLLSILNRSALPAGTYYVDIEPYSSSVCGAVTLTVSNFEPSRAAGVPAKAAPTKLQQLTPVRD